LVCDDAKNAPNFKEDKRVFTLGKNECATDREIGLVGIQRLADWVKSLDANDDVNDDQIMTDIENRVFAWAGTVYQVNRFSADPVPERRYRYQVQNYEGYEKYLRESQKLDRDDPEFLSNLGELLNELYQSPLREGAEKFENQRLTTPVFRMTVKA
jgi:hypothetical protein